MSALIKDIEQKINQGCVISEKELLHFVTANAKRKNACEQREGIPHGGEYPYTLIWFDPDRGESAMLHTYAADSNEAIIDNQAHIPAAVSVSAYPGHLPKRLKFEPDADLA